jgi:hypothetical protein
MTASVETVIVGSFVGKCELFARVVQRNNAKTADLLARRLVLWVRGFMSGRHDCGFD